MRSLKKGSPDTRSALMPVMEASVQGISSTVFDFTGGFTPKKLEPEFPARLEGRIRQRIVRAERIPINPFKRQEVDLGDGMYYPESDVDIAGRIAETIASVYNMGDQQKSAVYTASLTGLRKHGENMSFRDLSTELEDIGSSYSKTALSKIRQFIDIDPFVSGEAFDWSDMSTPARPAELLSLPTAIGTASTAAMNAISRIGSEAEHDHRYLRPRTEI